jgi:hypothetical protein
VAAYAAHARLNQRLLQPNSLQNRHPLIIHQTMLICRSSPAPATTANDATCARACARQAQWPRRAATRGR